MPVWLPPALIALACWGVWALLPKIAVRYLDPASALLYQALGVALVAIIVLLSTGGKPAFDGRGVAAAVVGGALGILGSLAYLHAVARGPVSLIATLTALYPAATIVLAMVLLQESLSLRQGLGLLLGIVAMVLIST